MDLHDPEYALRGLVRDRKRLLKQLARTLRRVGASHPNRSATNHALSVTRKATRKALRVNADLIAATVVQALDDDNEIPF